MLNVIKINKVIKGVTDLANTGMPSWHREGFSKHETKTQEEKKKSKLWST